jgi:hypothetical protein
MCVCVCVRARLLLCVSVCASVRRAGVGATHMMLALWTAMTRVRPVASA